MRKALLFLCITLFIPFLIYGSEKKSINFKKIISKNFKVDVSPFHESFNPSICKFGNQYILTFRYSPDPNAYRWVSYVGVMLLDSEFNPLTAPELLDLRQGYSITPSQTEDARIFTYEDQLYIIYNDNRDTENPLPEQRRDIYLAEISYSNGHFTASNPIKLTHSENYEKQKWEKNWTPFIYQDDLLLYYSIESNQVLDMNWDSGLCSPFFTTFPKINWNWGAIRGGTPAQMVDGEYLAFFHSSKPIKSEVSRDAPRAHYFMGAYTFSSHPPFEITKISRQPINGDNFYTYSNRPLRVIYPGGYVISENTIYIAYGKDDHEIWIASMSKDKLMHSLKSIKLKNRERH